VVKKKKKRKLLLRNDSFAGRQLQLSTPSAANITAPEYYYNSFEKRRFDKHKYKLFCNRFETTPENICRPMNELIDF